MFPYSFIRYIQFPSLSSAVDGITDPITRNDYRLFPIGWTPLRADAVRPYEMIVGVDGVDPHNTGYTLLGGRQSGHTPPWADTVRPYEVIVGVDGVDPHNTGYTLLGGRHSGRMPPWADTVRPYEVVVGVDGVDPHNTGYTLLGGCHSGWTPSAPTR